MDVCSVGGSNADHLTNYRKVVVEAVTQASEENCDLFGQAHKYEIKGLMRCFLTDIKEYFHNDNVCSYLKLGHLYELETLIQECHDYMVDIGGEYCGETTLKVTQTLDNGTRSIEKHIKCDRGDQWDEIEEEEENFPDVAHKL